jgi:hypothetical protein
VSSDNEKDNIFNAIMALYAGEDLDIVIEQLDSFADRNPDEVGFYIPQLCTYLFHVSNSDENIESHIDETQPAITPMTETDSSISVQP